MRTCEYHGAPFSQPRSHPWSDAAANPAFRYRDLKADPAAIRSSLEDLLPWSRYAAVDSLYRLIEWLNAPGGALESNDCAFTGPQPNETSSLPTRLECSGRVMILYRRLARNLGSSGIASLTTALHQRLAPLDPEFVFGMIGTTIFPVRYLALPGTGAQQLGHQLMISFWSWGDSEPELMANLDRVVINLSRGLGMTP